ncbi:hypothetical protein SEMRO_676_G185600.1 [Seminavis robusta]|uniref:Uncharacterized protein n=1 Tax=Seminavis robusta TaxID=568900 RepID=A0A9N8HJP3_9STRA|nr:hypothetical protein SEMRO_676_G185600.1 [Seminavis robusta]|eukprot:Sro676_g185600.1 n/a (261) ;mRNA; r:10590-11451
MDASNDPKPTDHGKWPYGGDDYHFLFGEIPKPPTPGYKTGDPSTPEMPGAHANVCSSTKEAADNNTGTMVPPSPTTIDIPNNLAQLLGMAYQQILDSTLVLALVMTGAVPTNPITMRPINNLQTLFSGWKPSAATAPPAGGGGALTPSFEMPTPCASNGNNNQHPTNSPTDNPPKTSSSNKDDITNNESHPSDPINHHWPQGNVMYCTSNDSVFLGWATIVRNKHTLKDGGMKVYKACIGVHVCQNDGCVPTILIVTLNG